MEGYWFLEGEREISFDCDDLWCDVLWIDDIPTLMSDQTVSVELTGA